MSCLAAESGEREKLSAVSAPSLAPEPQDKSERPSVKLDGKLEINTTRDNAERSLKAGTYYRQGVAALGGKNIKAAADFFKKSADLLESNVGEEKYLAEARFAQAQAQRQIGQISEASKTYQAAVDLFMEYDPLSPYLKASLDSLKEIDPALKGKVAQDEAKLKALQNPTRIITVDRSIKLKGSVLDSGNVKLLEEKATSDVASAFVRKNVKEAFVKMTCLETAELGSNYNTAEARWLPLISNGKTVTISASSDFLAPMISVKLNGRMYNVAVDLPELSMNQRTVFLLTDGRNVIAIDPASEDVWLMMAKFDKTDAHFNWKKLNHKKNRSVPRKATLQP